MRNVTVATIQPLGERFSFDPAEIASGSLSQTVHRIKRNSDVICDMLDRVGQTGVDIVCTPEEAPCVGGCALYTQHPDTLAQYVEATTEPFLQRIATVAQKYKMYIVTGCYLIEKGSLHNAAVLIDRSGTQVGRYLKTHLPAAEARLLTAGAEYPVFTTDFGNVAISICYDMNFPEVARIYSLQGANILFHPTQGFEFGSEINGEMRVRVRAFDNSLYIVTSQCASEKRNRPGRSCIVDFDGHILADAGYKPDTFASAVIDMDRNPFELTDAEASGEPNLRRRYRQERRPDTYGPLTTRTPE